MASGHSDGPVSRLAGGGIWVWEDACSGSVCDDPWKAVSRGVVVATSTDGAAALPWAARQNRARVGKHVSQSGNASDRWMNLGPQTRGRVRRISGSGSM